MESISNYYIAKSNIEVTCKLLIDSLKLLKSYNELIEFHSYDIIYTDNQKNRFKDYYLSTAKKLYLLFVTKYIYVKKISNTVNEKESQIINDKLYKNVSSIIKRYEKLYKINIKILEEGLNWSIFDQ
jgi:hypothetical protein